MKNHWSCKLVALVLAVVSGFTLTVSGASVLLNWGWDLYQRDPQQITTQYRQDKLDDWGYHTARDLAAAYLRDLNTAPDSGARELWESMFNNDWYYSTEPTEVDYILETGGRPVQTQRTAESYAQVLSFSLSMEDGDVVLLGKNGTYPHYGEAPEDYVWQSAVGAPIQAPGDRTLYYDLYTWHDGNDYRVDFYGEVSFQVRLCLTEEDVESITGGSYRMQMMKLTYSLRHYDWMVALGSLGVLLAAVLFLCFAAGKKPGTDEIRPRGTNAIPLDIIAAGIFLGGLALILLADEALSRAMYAATSVAVWLWMCAVGGIGAAAVLAATLALMALCAQVRLSPWQWLKRTVTGRVLLGILGWFGIGARKVAHSQRGLGRKIGTVVRSVYRNLPLSWQWLAMYGLLAALFLWVSFLYRYHYNAPTFILVVVIGVPVVLYTAHGFGRLRSAARRMSQGDLDTKIDTYQEFLYGSFAEFAQDLNALGDACTMAAQEKMKSERMKSELITNVSHDIKTPLTSIINYVDLLQMAQTEEQRREYLEVLERQSQRLKKLIEDLMEMSKANSGNIAVELQPTDVMEAVNQALGEFSDALNARKLKVVFRPGPPLMASCDGKLLWRVMSNVLGNVVKYALPGTRVYCDVTAEGRKVRISVKNISRDSLNITADELMERFVRGDQSRNSEGNGLGLNIARSLMEVQGGDLELTVDGDLFKVTLSLNQS